MKLNQFIRRLLEATIRIRTLLLMFLVFLSAAGIAAIWQSKTIERHFQIYAAGETEAAARFYGREIGPVNRLEIFEVLEEADAAMKHTINIRGERTALHTGPPLILDKDSASKFMHHWTEMRFHAGYSAMCHDPAFVIRFMMGKDVLLKTSLCLRCQNFTYPSLFGENLMGFNSGHFTGVAFAEHMRSLFPESSKWEPTDSAQSDSE